MNSETRFLLNNLNQAETALRQNLHTHFLDETARAHMERATSHVREAYIVSNEPGRARSDDQRMDCHTSAHGHSMGFELAIGKN